MPAKKKKQVAFPRCAAKDCSKKLTEAFVRACAKCDKPVVCKDHVYEHGCEVRPPSAPASSTLLSVAKRSKKNASSTSTKSENTKPSIIMDTVTLQDIDAIVTHLTSLKDITKNVDKPKIVLALEGDKAGRSSAVRGVLEHFGLSKNGSESGKVTSTGTSDKLRPEVINYLTTVVKQDKLTGSEESLCIGLAEMLGPLCQDGNLRDVLPELCLECKNDKVQKALASAYAASLFGMILDDTLVKQIEAYVAALSKGIAAESTRNANVYLCAALLKHGYPECMQQCVVSLADALHKNKKDASSIGCLKLIQQLCKELGQKMTPFLLEVSLIAQLVTVQYGQSAQVVRVAVKKMLVQYFKVLGPCDLDLVVPALLNVLRDGRSPWRSKALCLLLLGQVARQDVRGLSRQLPQVVPVVMECASDTKKEVSSGAESALESLAEVIRNPETIKLKPFLLPALNDPANIEKCLDEIMDCTFVNSIDSESLALMIPVVFRAMREGSGDLKQKSAITAGNICSLVANVNDLKPFVPLLLPELDKLVEDSNPKVRKFSITAKTALLEGINDENSTEAQTLPKAIIQVLEKNLASSLPDTVTYRYIAKTAAPLILKHAYDEVDKSLPSVMVSKHIEVEVKHSISALASDEECVSVAFNITEAWLKAHSRRSRNVSHMSAQSFDASQEKDYLVYIPSIILAFASKMLLRRTVLKMERAHRYAFVGQNGVGKTTLLDRIAAQDINGFPKDVPCYYVQHEILSEDKDLSVLGYMQRLISETKTITEEKISSSLEKVGFSDTLKATPVANLSGGWRMRLAIARSMLYDAKLLLLDEPTNHLDAEAIDWLQNYLSNLTNTTIALVSHDYDFLTNVATDIVHISDLKLTYYDCGFKEFQEARPEIVAALPRPKSNGNGMAQEEEKKDGELSALEALALDHDDPRFQAVIKTIKPIQFPEGGKLDGITSRGKPVMSLDEVSFRYPNTERYILTNISLRLNLNSRVVLVGPNGAGKSTLLKVLIGMEEIAEEDGNTGKAWRHHNLRSAYIAQHSMHHLESNLEQTPCQYIQSRFWEGRDKELGKMLTLSLTEQEKALTQERGEVCEILSRVKRGKNLYYEIKKNGRKMKEGNTEFKTLKELEALGKPHAVKLCRMFDEKMKASASGMDIRPLTTPEMIKHLKEFGIPEDLATRKIRWMSGGQKSRLVLAAAMWSKPHLIALDEPTNYLDNETLAALTFALKSFKGGVITISHHSGFVSALAKELWHVENGSVKVESLKKAKKVAGA